VSNGLLVDERRQAAPDVFGAGEVANQLHPLAGRVRSSTATTARSTAVAGQPGDLFFLRHELVARLDAAFAHRLARGDQLPACALGERLYADRDEHFVGCPQLSARVDTPTLAAQPLTV